MLHLFLQLTVILLVCRVVGRIGRFFGQTQVVSEMVAGVLLGPSLFGLLAPQMQQWLFPTIARVTVGGITTTMPHPSMSILYAISQIGLVLYMFLVGLEFDSNLIRGRVRSAGSISAAGIIVPFILGVALAYSLRGRGDLFAADVSPSMAALYFGAAMSITAFPMLARILYERGISRTRIGTITLAAGSLDDAIAWCLLAIVLASVKSAPMIALAAIVGGLGYGAFMLIGAKPMLRVFERKVAKEGGLSVESYTIVLLILMLCAWFTDKIGIYAVFGAFVCGVAMPRGQFAELVRDRTEMLTTSLLLPIFFVFSGLNTQIGLVLNSGSVAGAVIIAAIIGKGAACALAARMHGETWRDAVTIGTLMNARGLMELIILNIGLEKGIIKPALFTIMVLMAIVTTLMASPIFQWVYGRHMARESEAAAA